MTERCPDCGRLLGNCFFPGDRHCLRVAVSGLKAQAQRDQETIAELQFLVVLADALCVASIRCGLPDATETQAGVCPNCGYGPVIALPAPACSCICNGTCGCPCHDDEPGIDERRAAPKGAMCHNGTAMIDLKHLPKCQHYGACGEHGCPVDDVVCVNGDKATLWISGGAIHAETTAASQPAALQQSDD